MATQNTSLRGGTTKQTAESKRNVEPGKKQTVQTTPSLRGQEARRNDMLQTETSLRGNGEEARRGIPKQTAESKRNAKSKSPRIPTLRFKEFEGEWEERRLEKLFAEFKSGQNITAAIIKESGKYPVYGGNGLRGYYDDYTHEGDYFLIGRQGALCGNINRSKGKAYFSEHAIACLANDYNDTEWLAQRLEYYNLNRLSESSAQPGLSVSKLLRFKLTVPSLPEQQKIASFLSAVDKKIQQLTKKKELLEDYKKGVMQQLFSQKIRFKPSQSGVEGDGNGNEFPDWEEKRLIEFCSFFSGGTPSSTNKEYYSGSIPFIGSGNIHDLKVNNFISEEALNNSSANLVEKGDILYALYGANSGEVAISQLEGAINQAILCIRTNESIEYLYYILFYNKDNIVSKYLQGGQGNLSAQIIKKLRYKFPSLEEQQKIAKYLSAIDTKIEAVNQQIEKTKGFKKGLLQKMFV